MWLALRKLTLGFVLIAGASAILLISDWNRRVQRRTDIPRIAILQFASRPVMEENVSGMIEGLANQGFVDGKTISITRFNAENDMPTANNIAKEITSGYYPLVMSSSTPCLQAVANANKAGKAVHVFGAVTDPFGAGVGINPDDPLDHPKYLVGIGTFQPVERSFEIAKELYPGLKKVGVVWNSAEACSEACVLKARKKCKELGITLLEANVENSAGVLEAARSVVARDAEALWIGGDNTVELAIDALVSAANAGKIPVFCNNPGIVNRHVLFGLGANYHEVGVLAGEMAGRILKGTDPATIPIKNVVPERLVFNTTVLKGLKAPWKLTDALRKKADEIITPKGVVRKDPLSGRKPQPGRTYKAGLVYFGPDPAVDRSIEGILDGLRDHGFVKGKNFDLRSAHAQGEIGNIPSLFQNYDSSDVDLIISLTTPCLTAACTVVKKKPVVFTTVFDPIAAGAAKSPTDHVAHVTGVGSFPPLGDLVDMIQMLVPDVKTVGTIYNSSEANSRKVVSVARELLKKRGIRLEEVTVTGTNEVYQAAEVVAQKNIDVFYVPGDNTVLQAFDGAAKVAAKNNLPLVLNDTEYVEAGGLAACGIGFYKPGYAAGVMAARVFLGEKPADIPIEEIAIKDIAVNFALAETLGIRFPEKLLRECHLFVHLAAKYGRPAKIAIVAIVDNPLMDQACKGVIEGLAESGLHHKKDFTVKRYNAQGDASQLPTIMSAVRSEGMDLVVTAGSPTLMAAVNTIRDVPIVFTVASDPKALGLYRDGERPANLVGVHDDPPVARLLKLAIGREAVCTPVGTIWDPSQPNSEISVRKLRRACEDERLKLLESTPAGMAKLRQATESLIAKGAKIIVLSADNLTTTGFPAILKVARDHNVPIYTTEPSLVKQGATGAIGDDYGAWGKQSGRLAAKVLAGVKPSSLAIEKTEVQHTAVAAEPKPAATAPLSKTWRIYLVRYNDSPLAEDATKGVADGLAKADLVEGRDYTLKIESAQGDIATLNTIFAAIESAQADMVMTFSTPTLQAALHRFKKTPVVFSVVADAVVAGAAKTNTDHLPNCTGITTLGAFDQMPPILKECMPQVKRVGTLFTPAEANSVHNKEYLRKQLKKAGIELVDVPVNSTAEATDAAMSLCSKNIDAVCQCLDNLTSASFTSIARAANKAKLPVFGFVSEQAMQGAVLCLARDYYDAGIDGALVAARVMRGEDPAKIPIRNMTKAKLIVNLKQAKKLGMTIPESVIRRADKVIK